MKTIAKFRSFDLKSLPPSSALWLSAILFAGILAVFWDKNEKQDTREEKTAPEAAATYIPDGYVLVPIEVSNYQALDSLLGNYGIVDLYRPNENPERAPIKIAERIRILRAPLNPQQFAVLATEEASPQLVKYPGAYTVVVQNPKTSSGTGVVKQAPQKGRGRPHRRGESRITVEVSNAEVL